MKTIEKSVKNIFAFEEILKKAISKKTGLGEKEVQTSFEEFVQKIKDWCEAGFNPKEIPEFLFDYGTKNIPTFYICLLANEVIESGVEKAILENKEVQSFIELLSKCKIKYDYFVAKGGKFYMDWTCFAYDSDIFPELEKIFNKIKGDKKSFFTLALAIKKSFPEAWYGCKKEWPRFNYHTQIFKNYSGEGLGFLESSDDPVYQMKQKSGNIFYIIKKIMGMNIGVAESPNRDSNGLFDHYYIAEVNDRPVEPVFWNGENFPFCPIEEGLKIPLYYSIYSEAKRVFVKDGKGNIVEIKDGYCLKQIDWIGHYIVFGEEHTKEMSENFENSMKEIVKLGRKREEESIRRNMAKNFEGNAIALGFIEELEIYQIKSADYNSKEGVIVYVDERSEYGASGGIARFSQIKLWVNGATDMKEFQYRDRYSASNDNYAYDFKEVKILDIERISKNQLSVRVQAKPGNKSFSPIEIEFSIEVSEQEISVRTTKEEREKFLAFFEKTKEDVLKSYPKSNQTYFKKPLFNGDFSGHMQFPEPSISLSESKPKQLIGIFVTKEVIDAKVDILQTRYRLYLVDGKSYKEIYEDHAYSSEGDASIIGVEISGKKVAFTTRDGRKEHSLYGN